MEKDSCLIAIIIAAGIGAASPLAAQSSNTNSGTNSVIVSGTLNTISSGASNVSIVSGLENAISGGNNGFIGGGRSNTIGGASGINTAAIVAGFANTNRSARAVIGGGWSNTISSNARSSVIVGGDSHLIQPANPSFSNVLSAVIVGGQSNLVGSNGLAASIGGGRLNDALAPGATVPGGFANEAAGTNSFAAGSQAVASNTGTFVWADMSTNTDFISTASNQFLIRASGGVGINTNNPGTNALLVNGSLRVTGAIIAGNSNNASGTFAVVSGGQNNTASGNYATVGGGLLNTNLSTGSSIGGGMTNIINAGSSNSTIAGGLGNAISFNTLAGSVGGGQFNLISGGENPTIGGGYFNVANGWGATIPGGWQNQAIGDDTFAAGVNARATNTGSFVWSGVYDVNTFSTNSYSFTVRAPGGARFLSTTNTNSFVGVILTNGATAWASLSDRESKTDFEPIEPREILSKVAAMPITAWHYKHDLKRRYIGPMAQDFHTAFGLGDDKTISTLDTDGVMYAAIQGLVEELKERDKTIDDLRQKTAEVEELKARLEGLEQRLNSLPPSP